MEKIETGWNTCPLFLGANHSCNTTVCFYKNKLENVVTNPINLIFDNLISLSDKDIIPFLFEKSKELNKSFEELLFDLFDYLKNNFYLNDLSLQNHLLPLFSKNEISFYFWKYVKNFLEQEKDSYSNSWDCFIDFYNFYFSIISKWKFNINLFKNLKTWKDLLEVKQLFFQLLTESHFTKEAINSGKPIAMFEQNVVPNFENFLISFDIIWRYSFWKFLKNPNFETLNLLKNYLIEQHSLFMRILSEIDENENEKVKIKYINELNEKFGVFLLSFYRISLWNKEWNDIEMNDSAISFQSSSVNYDSLRDVWIFNGFFIKLNNLFNKKKKLTDDMNLESSIDNVSFVNDWIKNIVYDLFIHYNKVYQTNIQSGKDFTSHFIWKLESNIEICSEDILMLTYLIKSNNLSLEDLSNITNKICPLLESLSNSSLFYFIIQLVETIIDDCSFHEYGEHIILRLEESIKSLPEKDLFLLKNTFFKLRNYFVLFEKNPIYFELSKQYFIKYGLLNLSEELEHINEDNWHFYSRIWKHYSEQLWIQDRVKLSDYRTLGYHKMVFYWKQHLLESKTKLDSKLNDISEEFIYPNNNVSESTFIEKVTSVMKQDLFWNVVDIEISDKNEVSSRKLASDCKFLYLWDYKITFIYPPEYESKFNYLFEKEKNYIISKLKYLVILMKNKKENMKSFHVENWFVFPTTTHEDVLTWLPNKNLLVKFLSESHQPKTLFLFKINNFSKINEAYWFDIGDEVIIKMWKKIESLLWEYNFTFFKLNGSEFWAVIDTSHLKTEEERQSFAKEINEKLKFVSLDLEEIQLSISVNTWIVFNETEDVVQKAFVALNQTKWWAWTYFIYREEDHIEQKMKENLFYSNKIKEAFDNDFFVPFYQGILHNWTKRIVKQEALVRMKERDKIVPPWKFLDIIKQNGYLHYLSKVMIEKVFKVALEYPEVEFNINISWQDLINPEFIMFVQHMLKIYPIKTNKITFEILEHISLSDNETIVNSIQALKEFWFKIALDDFWAEKSNFARLTQIRPDYIKIDWKFIQKIKQPEVYKVIKAIYWFAKELWIEVVAEFVSDEEIFELVRSIWIEYSQWFFISQPQEKLYS